VSSVGQAGLAARRRAERNRAGVAIATRFAMRSDMCANFCANFPRTSCTFRDLRECSCTAFLLRTCWVFTVGAPLGLGIDKPNSAICRSTLLWAQAVGLVLTAPLGLPELLRARWSPGPLFSLLALGALGTGVAYVLTVVAAGRVGATKASATAFLIPPVALLLGVLVRGEHVAALSVLGVVCLAGAWLMRRAQTEHAVRGPTLGSFGIREPYPHDSHEQVEPVTTPATC
jgi:hypothetical protein